jgi:hypothetical protein
MHYVAEEEMMTPVSKQTTTAPQHAPGKEGATPDFFNMRRIFWPVTALTCSVRGKRTR